VNDLFRVKLQERGTSEIESFASYIYRLAYEHGVSAGEIVRYVFSQDTDEINAYKENNKDPKSISCHELVGTGGAVTLLVDYFEKLTGEAFYKSTFWFLKAAFARCAREVRKEVNWCPECFKEMELKGVTPYFKLIWHVNSISHCSIHRTPLMSVCSKCGKNQNTCVRKYSNHLCQHCRKNLSERTRALRKIEYSDSWNFTGADVLNLFNELSQVERKEMPEDGIVKSYEYILTSFLNAKDYEMLDVLSGFNIPVITVKRKVSLLVARRFAYVLNISLYDIITANVMQTTFDMDYELPNYGPNFMKPKKRIKKNHSRILIKIHKYLSDQDCPPSLRQVAEYVGVSVGYLEYRYKDLAKKIIIEHREYQCKIMLHKKYHAQKMALDFFFNEKYKRYNKSRRQAYKVLREETMLPKFVLKHAIQIAYNAMNDSILIY